MSHAEEFIAGSLSIEKCLADVDENDTGTHHQSLILFVVKGTFIQDTLI